MEYRTLQEEKDIFPFWKYKTMGDDRVRDSHAALDGMILPADDPFWQNHYPPWDWGCRCQVIPMNREEVEGIQEREAKLPPEQRTVIDGGARLERLRNGHLDRQMPATDPRGEGVGLAQLGEARTWDVQSDFQRGREDALKWEPGTLQIPVEKLKGRYDSDLWAAFERSMRAHTIPELGGASVWEWLGGETPSQSFGGRGLAAALSELKLDAKATVTADDMQRLLADMREDNPVRADRLVAGVSGADTDGGLAAAALRARVQEVLDYTPPALAQRLGGLKVHVADDLGERVFGQYKPRAHVLQLSRRYLATDPQALRETVFHEMLHPLQAAAPESYRQALADHFRQRIAGEPLRTDAAGWQFYRDKWWADYAGRVYSGEAVPVGRELAATYAELLTLPSSDLARIMSVPHYRETMELVLRIFYGGVP